MSERTRKYGFLGLFAAATVVSAVFLGHQAWVSESKYDEFRAQLKVFHEKIPGIPVLDEVTCEPFTIRYHYSNTDPLSTSAISFTKENALVGYLWSKPYGGRNSDQAEQWYIVTGASVDGEWCMMYGTYFQKELPVVRQRLDSALSQYTSNPHVFAAVRNCEDDFLRETRSTTVVARWFLNFLLDW